MNGKRMLGVLVIMLVAFTSIAQEGKKLHKAEKYYEAKVDTFVMENNLSAEKAEELKKTISVFHTKMKALKADENTTKADWKALRDERKAAIQTVLGDEDYKKWEAAHAKEKGKKGKHQHKHEDRKGKGKDSPKKQDKH